MTKIKIELEDLIDFIKSCGMKATTYHDKESNEIYIEIDGYQDGSIFCIDSEEIIEVD